VTPVADSLAVGDELPVLVDGPLTRTDFVRYQGASGDMNRIHHDDEYARSSGFPSVFAVGMRQAGVLGTHLADTFGPGSVRSLDVQFRAQAWPGDVISYRVTVLARQHGEHGDELELDLVALRQSGEQHLTGRATVVVPSAPPTAS
jgi:acyl dehydratase